MYKIPNENKFAQTNESDKTGNIYLTKNMNFDEAGYIQLEKRTRVIGSADDMADLENGTFGSTPVQCIGYTNNQLYIGANNAIYYSTATETDDILTWTKVTAAGIPTLGNTSDFLSWGGALYVASGSEVGYIAAANSYTQSTTDNGTFLCIFENLNLLAYCVDNVVKLMNSSNTVIQTLTLPTDYTVASMAWNNDRLYIGTIARQSEGDNAMLFVWDGLGTGYNAAYPIEGHSIFSVTRYKNGVALITSNGELMFCSGGLSTLAYLPIYYSKYKWSNATTSSPYTRVSARGLMADKDKLYLALYSRFTNLVDEFKPNWLATFPSGVWCFDPKVGLYHRWSVGVSVSDLTNAITTASVDVDTNVITVAGLTVPPTGTPCFYFDNRSTEIAGLIPSNRYFTIKVTDATLKLASTYANAIAGTAIDLTGTGNNAQYITFHPNSEFGGTRNIMGSIFKGNFDSSGNISRAITNQLFFGSFVQGLSATAMDTTALSTVQDFQENRGYFITPKLDSDQITDIFQKMVLKWKTGLNAEDKIVVKYRTADNTLKDYTSETLINITWVDSNTFTIVDDLSNVSVGDEVEFISGAGAGYLAHITALTNDAGTYTVDIDETVENVVAGNRGLVVFANWTKLVEIDATSTLGYEDLAINVSGKWIQLKVELRGIETKIEELQIINATHKASK
jgi:hypothetical protein